MPQQYEITEEDDLPVELTDEEDSDERFIPASEALEAGPNEVPANALVYHVPEPTNIQVRRSGSIRNQPPAPPGVEEWDFHRLFATFQVNWRATSPYYSLGRRSRRALLINWSVDDLKSVEATSRIYDDIARRCPGEPPRDSAGNPLVGALVCPCAAKYGADPEVWKGLACPAENLQAFRHFTQLIRDLEVRAEDHVDVMQVVEIVKLMIYESRCDQDVQDDGRMFDLQVGQLNQQTGIAYYNKVTAIALLTQGQLAQRRQKIYKELVATREARMEARRKEIKAAAALGNASANNGMVQAMTRLNARNIERRRSVQIEDAGRVSRGAEDEIDEGEDEQEVTALLQLPAPDTLTNLSDIIE